MEYVYSAMLLHAAGKPVSEENLKKILAAAGVNADDARAKALTAALEGVNIDEAIKTAVSMPTAAAPAAPAAAPGGRGARPSLRAGPLPIDDLIPLSRGGTGNPQAGPRGSGGPCASTTRPSSSRWRARSRWRRGWGARTCPRRSRSRPQKSWEPRG